MKNIQLERQIAMFMYSYKVKFNAIEKATGLSNVTVKKITNADFANCKYGNVVKVMQYFENLYIAMVADESISYEMKKQYAPIYQELQKGMSADIFGKVLNCDL